MKRIHTEKFGEVLVLGEFALVDAGAWCAEQRRKADARLEALRDDFEAYYAELRRQAR